MVEEAVQHEIDTLRKLVIDRDRAVASTLQTSQVDGVFVTQDQLDRAIVDLKEQHGLARAFAQEVSSLRVYATSQIEKAIEDLRAQNTIIRDMNRTALVARLDGNDKAIELVASEALRRYEIIDAAISDIKAQQRSADEVVEQKAQTANDALERLLNSKVDGVIAISDTRHDGTQLAVTEVRTAVTTASTAAQKALDSALAAAKSEVDAVDKKSFMRCESSEELTRSVNEKLTGMIQGLKNEVMGRITSQKELIDLGNQMSKEAITKAETSQDRRLDNLNEMRGMVTDSNATLLTRVEADAKIGALADKIEVLRTFYVTQVAADATRREVKTDNNMSQGTMLAMIAGAVGVVGLILAITWHQPTTSQDGKRVDDLISRFDALTRQSVMQQK